MRIVEPLERSEFPAFAIGDSFVFVVFVHWFLPHCKLVRGSNHGSDYTMLKISSAANALACPNFRLSDADPNSPQKIALPFSDRELQPVRQNRHQVVCGIELSRTIS